MAQLYEHYNVGDDAEAQTMWSATTWGAQTFTPSVAHRIISVRLKLQRHGLTPGTFTVSIRATSVGKPSNGDLCVGTIDGDDISDAAGGEWWEITLGGGIPIAETIVIRFLQDCSSTMRKIMFNKN